MLEWLPIFIIAVATPLTAAISAALVKRYYNYDHDGSESSDASASASARNSPR